MGRSRQIRVQPLHRAEIDLRKLAHALLLLAAADQRSDPNNNVAGVDGAGAGVEPMQPASDPEAA
jgi:hypothetical protein